MTVGYFCATPLHILHAVGLKLTTHRESTGDLVVYTHFDDAPRMVEVLSQLGLFRRVMLFDNHTRTGGGKLRRLWHSVVPAPLLRPWKRCFPFDEAVFFAIDPLTMSRLIAWGPSCRFYYGEDGIGSYINPTLYIPSLAGRLMLALTGRKKYMAKVAGIYLHHPALRVANVTLPGIPLPAPAMDDPTMHRVLEALWPVDEAAIDTRRRVMFFEEPLRELIDGVLPPLEKLVPRMVKAAFGDGQLYIKRHPRMVTSSAATSLLLPCQAPYERIMGLWKGEETVLISVISTASLQPLMLAGVKPAMVFLYRLLWPAEDPLRRLWDDFFDKLNDGYGLEGRLFLPESMAQLEEILTRLGKDSGLDR